MVGGEFQNVVVIICESPQVLLGVIGNRHVDPILVWNDTLRDGPRDVQGRAAGDSQVELVVGFTITQSNQSHHPIITYSSLSSTQTEAHASYYCHRK